MSEEKLIKCNINTPEAALFNDNITECVLPAEDGEWMVQFHHAPTVIKLGIGGLRLHTKDKWLHYFVEGGVVQVKDNQVSILCDRALTRAKLSRPEIERKLSELSPNKDRVEITRLKAKLRFLNAARQDD